MNNEAESKEAQKLFFELGYVWTDTKRNGMMKYYGPCFYSSFEDGDLCRDTHDVNHRHKELTLPQLRELVAQKQGLISGADALRALADGKEVERKLGIGWCDDVKKLSAETILHGVSELRIKPQTIKLELEIPVCGTNYKHGQLIWILNSLEQNEYCSVILDESDELPAYWWETEEEIKQVVAALRGGIKA